MTWRPAGRWRTRLTPTLTRTIGPGRNCPFLGAGTAFEQRMTTGTARASAFAFGQEPAPSPSPFPFQPDDRPMTSKQLKVMKAAEAWALGKPALNRTPAERAKPRGG